MGFLELRCLNGVSEEVRRGAQGVDGGLGVTVVVGVGVGVPVVVVVVWVVVSVVVGAGVGVVDDEPGVSVVVVNGVETQSG